MGLSASQARLLSVTARLSNSELQAQQIMNSKIRLSSESEYINQQYLEAMDAKKLQVSEFEKGGFVNKDVTYDQMTKLFTPNAMTGEDEAVISTPFRITDINGKIVIKANIAKAFESATDKDKFIEALKLEEMANNQFVVSYYENLYKDLANSGYVAIGDKEAKNAKWLEDKLRCGQLNLNRYDNQANEGKGGYVEEYWNSASFGVTEVTDDAGINKIKAKFDADLLNLQGQEKKLDLDLRKIDTLHNALQTEYDAVKKVIEKNIDRSFKTFNG